MKPQRHAAVLALRIGVLGVLVTGGVTVLARTGPASPCDRAVHFTGNATGEQKRLLRCYVGALAANDFATITRLADPDLTVDPSVMRFARDARTGEATAHVYFDANFTDNALVTIRYADGKRQEFPLTLEDHWMVQLGTWKRPAGLPSPVTH